MADFKSSVIVDLGGNLPRRARQFGTSLDRFSRNGQRSLGRLGRGIAATGRGLDRMSGRVAALGGVLGTAGAGRFVVNLERRFTRLGIQADLSADKIKLLKDEIFDVSRAPDISIDPAELTSAVEAIVEKTGDLAFARDNLRNLGLSIQATGGLGSELGALTAEFKKLGLEGPKAVSAALDTLIRQGKAGAFTVGNLAGQGERLVSAYVATGRVGPGAVREIGAVAQVIRQGTGNAEQATTAFEAVLRTLQDATKVKFLQGAGIQVFEPDQPGVMRAVNEIMTDIITKTGGDTLKISKVFDAEAMRAFNAAIGEFKQTGGFPSLEKFLAIQGDGAQLLLDSSRAAQDSAGALTNLSTAAKRFADANLSGPIQGIADALNGLDKGQVDLWLKILAGGAAAAIAGPKLFRAGRGIARLFSGGRGGASGALGAAAGGLGATPVFVTNFPVGFGGGGAAGRGGRGRSGALGRFGAAGAGAAALGRGGRLSAIGGRLARIGGRAAGPLAAVLSALSLVDTLSDNTLTTRQKASGAGGALGGLGGALGGAALGTALLPGIGTILGAIVGGLAGEFAGSGLGGAAADALDGGGQAGRAVLEIRGAPPGTTLEVIDGDLDLEAGAFMEVMG